MKIYTIVTDKNGEQLKLCVNAQSQKHGTDKAYKYSIRHGFWPKRIQAFEESRVIESNIYSIEDYKPVIIK